MTRQQIKGSIQPRPFYFHRIDEFNATLEDYREQLEAGVRMLADHFDQFKSAAIEIRFKNNQDPPISNF